MMKMSVAQAASSSSRVLRMSHPLAHSGNEYLLLYANSPTHRSIVSHSPYNGFSSRRHYSRLVRAFISKHIEAWTDAVRPLATVTSSLSPVSDTKQTKQPSNNAQEITLSDEDTILSDSSKHQITTDLRYMMRHVPHPVAIITATNPNAQTTKETFRGMTVSTFNTVTLYPEPVISFNVKTPSESYNAICQTKRFLVHLLSPKPSTARLARDFARGNEYLDPEHASCLFNFVSPDYEKNSNQAIAVGLGEPPMLMLKDSLAKTRSTDDDSVSDTAEKAASPNNTPDFPFVLECRSLPQSLRVGSHVVVLGKVVRIITPGKAGQNSTEEVPARAHRPDELCLAYADTRFWQVAKTVDPTQDSSRNDES